MRRVPFFDYPGVFERYSLEFTEALQNVGKRGAFVQQREVVEFEEAIAERCGVRHCIAVGNATDGLQMAFMAGGIRTGDEVIISTHTMVATASAVHFAGGVPIPVGVGPDHQISPAAIREAIGPRTAAICPTQLNGRTADMDAIGEIAEEFGLDVYEDAAQGLGSQFRGKAAGSWGVGSCLSFYPAKILGTLGDGGAVLTNDDDVAATLRLMRDHGRVDRGDTVLWGFNSRLDNLHAAFLLVQLKDFDRTVEYRRTLAEQYCRRLADVPGITLPPAPVIDGEHFDTFQNFEIECDQRDELQAGLADRGIGTLQQWGGWPIHRFRELGFTQEIPSADELFDRMLMLPMNVSLKEEDVDYICDSVLEIAEGWAR